MNISKKTESIINISKYIFYGFLLCLIWLITMLITLLKEVKIDRRVLEDDDSPDYTTDPTCAHMACNIYHSDWNDEHYS